MTPPRSPIKHSNQWKTFSAALAVMMVIAILGPGNARSQQSAKQSAEGKPAARAAPPAAVAAGSPSGAVNPFDRYLADAKANRPEAAVVRFANLCGVDLNAVTPKFAQRPRERWEIVKDLHLALADQETDYYHTLEVWQAAKRVVAEEWGIAADSGDYYRVFTCLENRRVNFAQTVNWNIPDEEESPGEKGWGYEVYWALTPKGKFARARTTFLDLDEKPMAAPTLEADVKQDLEEEEFGMRTWVDLGYPAGLLK